MHSLAAPFGSFASGPLSDYLGRRPTLMITIVPLLIGWITIANASSHFLLILGRIAAGFGVGLIAAPAQVMPCIFTKNTTIIIGVQFT